MKNFYIFFTNAINYLKSNNISQKEIAEKIGLQPQSLSQIMKGKRNPTVINISKLFTEYNFNPEWLLTGNGPMLRTGSVSATGDEPPGYSIDELISRIEQLEKTVEERTQEINRLMRIIEMITGYAEKPQQEDLPDSRQARQAG